MKKRKICVATGSRADYGLLYWLMRDIQNDPALELQVLATGSHLMKGFGGTLKNIREDGFPVTAARASALRGDSALEGARYMGSALAASAKALAALKPDVLVVLGDRYEMLAVAVAASFLKIPVAHLHGGESTEGAFDEAMRHAITKFAHFHFVAAAPYGGRIVRMGERPERVFNFGAPGLDHLRRTQLVSRRELEQTLAFPLRPPVFLVTYHPVTLSKEGPEKGVKELLKALDAFPDATVLFTGTNADPRFRAIRRLIRRYAASRSGRARYCENLGSRGYLSAMRCADVVVGNSSSGIIEAPALKKPSVNLGDRQKGRLRAASVIDCPEKMQAIVRALRRALSPSFRSLCRSARSPYGAGGASRRIKDALKAVALEGVLMKSFYGPTRGAGHAGR